MKQRAGINFSIVATGFLVRRMGNTGVFAKETDLLKLKKKITHNESRHRTDGRDEGRGESMSKGVTVIMEHGM